MAISPAERMKNYRKRRKRDGSHNILKAKDRIRKNMARSRLPSRRLAELRTKQNINLRKHRAKTPKKLSPVPRKSSFGSKQMRGKAVKQALESLPANKSEQVEIIKAPGRRGKVTVKEDGEKKIYQRRFLLFNLREAYGIFTNANPTIQISRSSFAHLRPPYISIRSSTPHSTCTCIYHENVHLLLKSIYNHIHILKSLDLRPFIELIVCDDETEACMMMKCDTCIDRFDEKITKQIKNEKKNIAWTLWTTSDDGRAIQVDYNVWKNLSMAFKRLMYSHRKRKMTLECEYLEKMTDLKHEQESLISCSSQMYDTFNNENLLTTYSLVNTLEGIHCNEEIVQTLLSTNNEDKQKTEDVYEHENTVIVKDTIIHYKNVVPPVDLRFVLDKVGLSIVMAMLKSHHKWTTKMKKKSKVLRFVTLNIEDQLKLLFSRSNFYNNLHGVSLTNTGVRLFESRESSFVPMYLAINELPLKERFQPHNIILIGIWANEVHINRQLLQKVFEIICVQLLTIENGINLYVKDLDLIRNIAVYNIITVTDKVMKNKCMNMVQHNGSYGCAYCLNPGKHFKTVKGGHIMSFPRQYDYNYRLRSITTYNYAMTQLQQGTKLYQGHYDPSVLQSLKFHHFPNSFIVESMHTIYLGVTKQCISLWIDPSHAKERWSFYAKKEEFQAAFNNIHLPTSVYKPCRPFCDGIKHKANELRTFLLAYFPILELFLDDIYFHHFLLLVDAIYMLSDVQHLTTVIVQQCHEILLNFVEDYGLLYNEHHVKPVVEDIAHIGPQCLMFGPLINYDAFGFAAVNGFFHDLINGNRNMRSSSMFHTKHNMFNVMFSRMYPMNRLSNSKTIDQINILDKEAEYVKHCYYKCNQLLRSELTAKKNKIYTDTVVHVYHNNVKQVFHIKLIFLSNYCWYTFGHMLNEIIVPEQYQNMKNIVAFGKFVDVPEIIEMNCIIERLTVFDDKEYKLIIRLPFFGNYS
ncbi:unnamed protein product [Didymodactylos carnosus]|uniref:Uncharacterized protein n=1 Tax=Didymodactylos carnosus TaxID=1234261 RepID=A0A814X232_9BILA|nr:unnamed protein product [Didymodactylos carnosus]CAF3974008.1 unnamed protein product [Didymodactylos carnosus]